MILSKWVPHVINTQLPYYVSGVSGVRSISNVGVGLVDLILLPLQQYQKDGRILRGWFFLL